jgi:hypothetical protein
MAAYVETDMSTSMPMHSQVLHPQPWDKQELEEALRITVPGAIAHLWNMGQNLWLAFI